MDPAASVGLVLRTFAVILRGVFFWGTPRIHAQAYVPISLTEFLRLESRVGTVLRRKLRLRATGSKALGCASPFFSTIVLFKTRPFPLGLFRFFRKTRIPGKNGIGR